jgi:hypothetical protein
MNKNLKRFTQKHIYDEYMDPEVVDLCNAINALPGVYTTESCCGHRKGPFHIWFKVEKNINEGLFFLVRCVDRRYWKYGWKWRIEMLVGDEDGDGELPIHYLLTTKTIKGKNAYKQAKDLVKNMEYHLNHENFIKLYNIHLENFSL